MNAPRSCLTVPGSSPKMIAKAAELPADQVILDLEDSVAPAEKDRARANVLAALGDARWAGRLLSVRINAVGSDSGRSDLEALREASRLDSVIVPKVGSADDVAAVEVALAGAAGIEVLVETAAGLAGVRDIASASPRVVALVFGPLDLGASLGVHSLDGVRVDGFEGDVWYAARFQILVAARAAGARAIDGPFPLIDDPDGLRAAASRSRALGYDGKWVIHPSQIEVVNEVFTPTAEEIERAREVLRALAGSAGEAAPGAIRLGDLMVDEATRRLAEAILARARAAGLEPER